MWQWGEVVAAVVFLNYFNKGRKMKRARFVACLAVAVGMAFGVGNASALPLPAEYEVVNPDTTVGMPSYAAGDLGYYIWTGY